MREASSACKAATRCCSTCTDVSLLKEASCAVSTPAAAAGVAACRSRAAATCWSEKSGSVSRPAANSSSAASFSTAMPSAAARMPRSLALTRSFLSSSARSFSSACSSSSYCKTCERRTLISIWLCNSSLDRSMQRTSPGWIPHCSRNHSASRESSWSSASRRLRSLVSFFTSSERSSSSAFIFSFS